MKAKNGKFDKICGSKLYPVYWMSKFRYIASIVCFDKKICDDVEKKVVSTCLSATGFNMRFPRAVVFGSKAYGGMGWDSLFNTMIYEKVKIFVNNIRKNNRLGSLLKIATETTQLHAGISDAILHTNVDWSIWCPNTWITHLFYCLQLIGKGIQTTFKTYRSVRKFDRNLMDVFYLWGLTKSELENINICRIYLQVITISDITSMTGDTIMEEYCECKKIRESILKWPNQCEPTKSMKATWKSAMHRLCLVNNYLIRPLGQWTDTSHQLWNYMIEEEGGRLLRYDGNEQWAHYTINATTYTRRSHRVHPRSPGIPVQVLVLPIGYKVITTDHVLVRTTNRDEDITSALRWAKTSVGHVKCKDRGKFATSWKRGSNILIGTDGGLKSNIGTTGIVIEMEDDREIKVTAMSAERCTKGSLHSTREELRALLEAEMIIERCGDLWGRHCDRRITFICDSKSALSEVELDREKWKDRNFMGPEVDVLITIDALKEESQNIRRVYQWEKAHQSPEEGESNERRINREADELATECRDNVVDGLICPTKKLFMPKSQVSLILDGHRITKGMKTAIHQAVHDMKLAEFLMGKYGWTQSIFNNIDWKSMEACLFKRPSIYITSIMKLIHRWQPTLTKTSCYDRDTSKIKCSLCSEREVQHHYIYCQHEEFIMARKNEWLHFKKRIQKWKIHEDILLCMWVGMESWSTKRELVRRPDLLSINDENNREMSRMLDTAYNNQNDIGWYHLFLGRMSKEWKSCIRMGYDDDDVKADGKAEACIRSVIKNMWTMMLKLWKVRNDVEHGNNVMCSKRDIAILHEIVDELYENFSNAVENNDKWIFEKEQNERKNDPVVTIATWVELVCTIYLSENKNDVSENELKKRIDDVLRRISLGTIYET